MISRRLLPLIAVLPAAAPLAASVAAAEASRPLVDPGFAIERMDLSVAPGTDFARFAAGKWYETTQIPADKSRWGGFDELREQNWAALREIVEETAAQPAAAGSVPQKVGDFYASAMDTARINALGLKPIEADLAAIADAKDKEALFHQVAQMHLRIGSPFLGLAFFPDQKQSDVYGFYLFQGGLSLPSKEYYFSEKFARERWEFVGHVAKMLELAGEPRAAAFQQAETVFALEKALAENAKLPVELRDRLANYNKMTIDAAASAYAGLPLKQLVQELGVPATVRDVIVGQPKFFEGLSKELQARSLDELKVYTRWQLLRAAAPLLSEPLEAESFRFYGTVLNGTPQQEPRWQRATKAVDGAIGEALGQLYVEKRFPPAARARMMELIENVKAVMRDRLAQLEWMTEPTRQKALEKFSRFRAMIGYPAKWRDYSSVEIKRDDYFGNAARAAYFNSRRVIDRLGRKVDKDEWGMTPPTVNAYFSSVTNQIVFPAGILQPPFFDVRMDDAVNYGAIAAVIGHEITHGFDDQGRRSDADGNLVDWWTPEDEARFKERAQMLVAQYNSYEALPGLHVNGQLTLGENIADLGGVSIAFEALQRSLRGQPTPPKIDGFTAEQRFFISWAQQWRTQFRDDALRLQVARDPHAPGNIRAFGPLVNFQPFYDAFAVKEGDRMWRSPAQRAKIW
ncbi:M13 family metallopeptidase [Opitutus terrae]|uniref:Neprilysin n=1 Tax=Opitutus terrae (strain DSM 11246 / JCM 15787 / PB90-1) TaxID=452637 RepID=B1ZWY3_OPITP|nr:M13 family metallopeptidase [Opitutus terrae]ACB75094.1 Neprilysin [Opitutus terrae PB90-1]